jgi:hypothetical protein
MRRFRDPESVRRFPRLDQSRCSTTQISNEPDMFYESHSQQTPNCQRAVQELAGTGGHFELGVCRGQIHVSQTNGADDP